MIQRNHTALVLLLFGLAAYGSGTAISSAFGGYSSSDIVGTWTCTQTVQGTYQARSLPFVVNMNANGTAVARWRNAYGSEGATHFTWAYRATGPNSGIITDPPGTGNLVWQSHSHVDVHRITRGSGLLMTQSVDCNRG